MMTAQISNIQLFKTIVQTTKQLSSECKMKLVNNNAKTNLGSLLFQISTPKYFFEVECPVENVSTLVSSLPVSVDTRNLFTISRLMKKTDKIVIDLTHDDGIVFNINDGQKEIKLKTLDSTVWKYCQEYAFSVCAMDSAIFGNIIKEMGSVSSTFQIISDGSKVKMMAEQDDNGLIVRDASIQTYRSQSYDCEQDSFKPLLKLLKNNFTLILQEKKGCKFSMRNSGICASIMYDIYED